MKPYMSSPLFAGLLGTLVGLIVRLLMHRDHGWEETVIGSIGVGFGIAVGTALGNRIQTRRS